MGMFKRMSFPWAVSLGLAAFLLTSPYAGAQSTSATVGMITGLSGEVQYRNAADRKESGRAVVLMKVHREDVLQLSAGSRIQVVFFSGGRQEAWKGPLKLRIGENGGQVEGGVDPPPVPEVKTLPVKVAQSIENTAYLPPADAGRSGHTTLRGKRPATPLRAEAPAKPPGSAEQPGLTEARTTYREMKLQGDEKDLVPEIFLINALIEYEEYGEAKQLVDRLLKKYPNNPALRGLKSRTTTGGPSRG